MQGVECKDHPELFYPHVDENDEDVWIDQAAARDICNRCPRKPQCLDYAIGRRETEGIWAATDGDERRKIRLRQTKTLPGLLQDFKPSIRRVAELYAVAEEALYVKSKVQTLQNPYRKGPGLSHEYANIL